MDRKWRTVILAPRSPNLTPLDFFLWEHVKTVVHATKSTSLEDLKAKPTNVISGITINQLANVYQVLQNHITLCSANDGGHVET